MLGNAAAASEITSTSVTLDGDVAQVMEELHPKLFRYARFRLERPEAEDATSAAMERMWRMRRRIDCNEDPWSRGCTWSASIPSAMRSGGGTGDLRRSRIMTSISRIIARTPI